MNSFTLNTTAAYDFAIFDGSVATNELSAASLHLLVLQHRNWRASISVVDRDDYKVAKLYLVYCWTTDSARLYFYLSLFSTDPELQTNCPRQAFIFRFYNIGIGEHRVRLLTLTTTKSLSFLPNIDWPATTTISIFIWVDFRWIPSNEPIVAASLHRFCSTT